MIAALGLLVLVGCAESNDDPVREPGVLELGIRLEDGTFEPIQDGASMAVLLGANGLNMIVPSLRVLDADPIGPDPTVLVEVGGVIMAADIEGSRVDMEDTGAGYALWDLRVPFQTNLCCYVCQDGLVRATLTDRAGREFVGEVTVRLERGGCPDETACCAKATACPDPTTTLVCE